MSRTAVVLLICGFTLGPPRVIAATTSFDQAAAPGLSEIASLPAIEMQAVPAQPARPATPRPPGQPAPPPPPAAPAAPVLPTPPAAPAAPVSPPAPLALPVRTVNVQLEFTITDQTGTGAPDKKTVSMLTSNATWGRIRASAAARPRGQVPLVVSLNVDARPYLTVGDLIQTEITIEYRPVGSSISAEPGPVDPTVLNQSLTVVLQSGKSIVISQAADPITDRKIIVEVKATILK